MHDAATQLTVVGVEVAQHVLHLLLDRDRRDVRRNDLRRAARDLREVSAERHVALDAELLLDAALERALRRRFAVDDEDLRGLRARDLVEPAHDLVGVGMSREAVEALDLRLDRDFLAEHAHARDAVDEPAAKAPLRLVADEQDCRLRTPEVVFEMMQHAARIGHARRRNDDGRALRRVECARLRRRLTETDLREIRHLAILAEDLERILVEIAEVLEEDARRIDGQRTIDDDWDVRVEASLTVQPEEIVEQRLRAADGERRDDEVAAAVHRLIDDLNERRLLVVELVQAVAVRRLRDDEVGAVDDGRVAQDRLARLTEVAREDELRLLAVLLHVDFEDGRAEDVARIAEEDAQVVRQTQLLVVRDRRKLLERIERVVDAVERFDRRIAAALSLAVEHLGIRLLDMCRVGQHNLGEVAGRLRRVDRPLESLAHELRHKAAVIDMRMRQEHAVDVRWIERELLVVVLTDAL